MENEKPSIETTSAPKPRRGKQKVRPNPATPEMLGRRLFVNVREFSALTATPLATCYSLIKQGKIPGVVRIGSSIRIPVSSLKAMVAA